MYTQSHSLYPVCVLKCLLRVLFAEKALSHWLHLYCFSPVCIFRWVLSSFCCEKSFVTLAAFIWFLPCVCPQMFWKVTFEEKSFLTLAAFIWFPSSTCFKMGILQSSFNTLGDFMYPYPLMYHLILHKTFYMTCAFKGVFIFSDFICSINITSISLSLSYMI